MKILIADDSKAMRMIVKRTLRMAGFGGYDTIFAVDGREALELIGSERPDLVLSDWNMPEMTGIELLEAVREQGLDVKFGFVTTEATPEMRKRAADAGSLFLIAKPFTAETFENTLGPLLA